MAILKVQNNDYNLANIYQIMNSYILYQKVYQEGKILGRQPVDYYGIHNLFGCFVDQKTIENISLQMDATAKALGKDFGQCVLPDIRWHDLRSTYCTLLLKNDFSPKAVSKLMGHSKEIVTVDVYADKTVLAYDVLAETEDYVKSLLPDEEESCREDILNIVIDVSPYLPEE